jgi:FecR protein
VSSFNYNAAKPAESSMALSLVQGGMRAITGLIGKSKPSNVTYRAGNATIGIRGTDTEIGADSGDVYVIVTSGEVDYFPQGATASVSGNPVGMNLALDANTILLAQAGRPIRLGAGQGSYQRGNNPPNTGPANQIRSTVAQSNPNLNNAQQQQQSQQQQNSVNQSQQNSQQQQNQQQQNQQQQPQQQQTQQPTSGQSGSSGSGGSGGGTSTR